MLYLSYCKNSGPVEASKKWRGIDNCTDANRNRENAFIYLVFHLEFHNCQFLSSYLFFHHHLVGFFPRRTQVRLPLLLLLSIHTFMLNAIHLLSCLHFMYLFILFRFSKASMSLYCIHAVVVIVVFFLPFFIFNRKLLSVVAVCR